MSLSSSSRVSLLAVRRQQKRRREGKGREKEM
jgi:hypothetical protein